MVGKSSPETSATVGDEWRDAVSRYAQLYKLSPQEHRLLVAAMQANQTSMQRLASDVRVAPSARIGSASSVRPVADREWR